MRKIIFLFGVIFLPYFSYADSIEIPFYNLPKTSPNGDVQYVKVIDKQYRNFENKTISIDYIFLITRNNIENLTVLNILQNSFVFYINDSGYGRKVNSTEMQSIEISFKKDEYDNIILYLKNVPKNVFRVNFDVSVRYLSFDIVTVLELIDDESFPDKFLTQDSFFDRKDFSIGRFVRIEK